MGEMWDVQQGVVKGVKKMKKRTRGRKGGRKWSKVAGDGEKDWVIVPTFETGNEMMKNANNVENERTEIEIEI